MSVTIYSKNQKSKFLTLTEYGPVFDSFLEKKVLNPALGAAFRTFVNFLNARYASGFFV